MQRNASEQNAKRGVWTASGSDRFSDRLHGEGCRASLMLMMRHPALLQPMPPHACRKLSAVQAEQRAGSGRRRVAVSSGKPARGLSGRAQRVFNRQQARSAPLRT